MDYSALIGPAVVAAVASGPRKNKRLLWVTTVICLALGGCAKRGSPASVAIEIVLQIACLGLLVFTIFRLRKTHAHQIYIIWYIFFLGFVPFFWIFYAIISPDRHLDWAFGESGDKLFHFAYQYLTDFKAEVYTVLAVVGLVVVPQLLTYIVSGLSGSASMPVFVSQITNIAVWSIIKFLAAFGGVLFAEPTAKWAKGEGFSLHALGGGPFVIASAFLLAWVHAGAKRAINSLYHRDAFSLFRHVHEFFTRFSSMK